ncbi:hypothetical protein Cgig2_018973 [Carnegiea gigantea]|uniref:RNase H type-1 domain-containing protein n=1 Tax=Carnegiea gigantea TaxID=171969 RepID=A0A9Q1K2A4_9CARY|nr:hypothetical protein Cgig2_018973 [Carnegiea gigantea]
MASLPRDSSHQKQYCKMLTCIWHVVCREESNIHCLLECPLARCIWESSAIDRQLWDDRFRTVRDCVELTAKRLDANEIGEFVAILWECWNAQNPFLFGKLDQRLDVLSHWARSFVHSCRETKLRSDGVKGTHPCILGPPQIGILKLNFDGSKIGIRAGGDIVQAGAKQGQGFARPEVEEARSYLFALQQAKDFGHTDIIVEGDCLGLVQVLKSRIALDNSTWDIDVPDAIVSRASEDMFAYVDSNLI